MSFAQVKAVLFDKDGTLFDFSASWSGWAAQLLADLSEGDQFKAERLAAAIEYDLSERRFKPSSPVIAGTLAEATELLLPHLPEESFESLSEYLLHSSAATEMVAPLPLVPLLDGLAAHGLKLGVATNDGVASAIAHLTRAGILEHFTQVLGYDSGYTPKPAPDMLLGFAAHLGLSPEQVVMVGDSTHDLVAGRAAGMPTIGVLTGMASATELYPYADKVLPDIGHLPDALGLLSLDPN